MTKRSKILLALSFSAWLIAGLAGGLIITGTQGCNTRFVSDTGRELPPGLGYAVQVLEAGQTIYDTSLTIAGTLHCNNKISDETARKIVNAANIYYLSHNAAQIAVDGWMRTIEIRGDTETAKAVVFSQLTGLAAAAMDLVRDVKTLTGKGIDIPDILSGDNIRMVFGVK